MLTVEMKKEMLELYNIGFKNKKDINRVLFNMDYCSNKFGKNKKESFVFVSEPLFGIVNNERKFDERKLILETLFDTLEKENKI